MLLTHRFFGRISTTHRILRLARMSSSSRSFVELKIPVPYGHIAAKEWGPPDGRPVLALHGWQDNAGTFDTLIPSLEPNLRVVALDFPGHGLSSHKPPGSLYHYLEGLLDIRYAVDHLNWNNFTILGHSMGAGVGLIYTSVYPNCVDSVVALDLVKPVTCPASALLEQTAIAINRATRFTSAERQNVRAPVYSYDDALNRLLTGTMGSLTKESAEILLKRGLKPSADGQGFEFSRDIRLQIESLQRVDDEACRVFLSGVKCNLLMIKASKGIQIESNSTVNNYRYMYTENCRNFLYVEVEGTHHVHLNNPETVAPLINTFLSSNPKL